MGNCQAVDNASLVIQHQSGRVERLYASVTACEVMKLNPGHCVSLLLTTTLYPSSAVVPTTKAAVAAATTKQDNQPVRITRIKLLRSTDTLTLGHSYRLITTKEVMKGLSAKKYEKMKKQSESSAGGRQDQRMKEKSAVSAAVTRYEVEKTNQVKKHEKHRSRPMASSQNSAAAKPRGWHPSLNSISEATI